MADLVNKILEAAQEAHNNTLNFKELFSQDVDAGKNQYLMFIKPEILFQDKGLKTQEMVELVLSKIDEFGLKIHNVKALGAKYLEEHNIIAQHYGVINKISNDAKGSISDAAKEKFTELYGKSIDEAKVLGGLEFLRAYPEFTPYTADILWQAQVSKKLAGGTYIEEIKMDNEVVYLINGFHARQIHHFTQAGRGIIVLTVSGDTTWEKARDDMIGNTFPERANKGSIRGEFLAQKDHFGLPEVTIANNGVHLSAGPVEGLIELIRYNTDFSKGSTKQDISEYAFGKALINAFGAEGAAQILENPNLDVDGQSVSVFDLTELKNSDEALDLLKKYFK